MNELTLIWTDAGQVRTEIIRDQQLSKNPGTIRLGRDPARCDILLTDPTVSGLHIEIFFNPQLHGFYLRNLRQSNPPLVDGKSLIQGEVPLRQGSTIYLGQLELKVSAISLAAVKIPPTILMPPSAPVGTPQQPNLTAATYGLQCPRCRRISAYTQLNIGCSWCGTSLASAVSVLVTPKNH